MGPRSAWMRGNGTFAPLPEFDWEAFEQSSTSHRTAVAEEDLAAIFEDGHKRLRRADAARMLEAWQTGAKRAACYAALKADGRFASRLAEEDGLLHWLPKCSTAPRKPDRHQ